LVNTSVGSIFSTVIPRFCGGVFILRAVIISGGDILDYAYIHAQIRETDTIICADSGFDHAVKMGIKPDIVVGDFDSISGDIPADVARLQYPARKDLTDTEIAIEHARGLGFRDFLLLGAVGSRIDHSLTNILLLTDFLRRGENAAIINENNKVMITNSQMHLSEPVGSIVSLVPLTDCRGVTTVGLEYVLDDADMTVGKGLGVSNIMAQSTAGITVASGTLLIIIAKD